jgi:hypothetical protein
MIHTAWQLLEVGPEEVEKNDRKSRNTKIIFYRKPNKKT